MRLRFDMLSKKKKKLQYFELLDLEIKPPRKFYYT